MIDEYKNSVQRTVKETNLKFNIYIKWSNLEI